LLRRSKTDRAAAAAADALQQSAGRGVLVANDDDDSRELLCRVIAAQGAVSVPAYDIDGVIQSVVGTMGIGAVVLDFSNGTATSFSILEAIRQELGEAGRPMPAVMMIATSSANRTLAFDSGVDEFLTRPFHVNEFTTALAEMMGRSVEEREAKRVEASLAGRGLQELQD